MTTTLKIEHSIVSFEIWQNAFERDPIGRERAGVRRYRVCRPADDPNYVMIDLDFDGHAEAEAFLEKLREVWRRVELSPGLPRAAGAGAAGTRAPRTRIVDEVAAQVYR
jgi:hypothetical protein